MFKLARWADAGKAADEREAAELNRAQVLSRQLRRRIAPALRGSDKEATVSDSEAQRVSPNERVLRDLLTSSFLSSKGPDAAATASLEKFRPTVVFRLFWGRIDEVDSLPAFNAGNSAEPLPVDAVSVGHYLGVRPQAIMGSQEAPPPSELILTQYTDCGLLRGDLGTTFFLPMKGGTDRVLAVAGMGPVGGCGAPE